MAPDGAWCWFDDVRVELMDMRLMCMVGGRMHPLPVATLHPECTLARVGDRGRLGVPQWWAKQRGLLKGE